MLLKWIEIEMDKSLDNRNKNILFRIKYAHNKKILFRQFIEGYKIFKNVGQYFNQL